MDNIILKPDYNSFTNDKKKIADIYKNLSALPKKIIEVNKNQKTNQIEDNDFFYDEDYVYSFVYTYLKKIAIKKSVEEFESDSESSESDEYLSDLEYSN